MAIISVSFLSFLSFEKPIYNNLSFQAIICELRNVYQRNIVDVE